VGAEGVEVAAEACLELSWKNWLLKTSTVQVSLSLSCFRTDAPINRLVLVLRDGL
jgi:hypothetical protein